MSRDLIKNKAEENTHNKAHKNKKMDNKEEGRVIRGYSG